MNILAIDYGTKRIGLAYSVQGVIELLPHIPNDAHLFSKLNTLLNDYQIERVVVGISEGEFAAITKAFVTELSEKINLPVETVEEQVSTIEAEEIFKANRHSRKNYKSLIDSIAAAVILRRFI